MERFERDLISRYPALGKLPIASITPAIVAKAIEDINKRNLLESATRILQHLNGVFRYPIERFATQILPSASEAKIAVSVR